MENSHAISNVLFERRCPKIQQNKPNPEKLTNMILIRHRNAASQPKGCGAGDCFYSNHLPTQGTSCPAKYCSLSGRASVGERTNTRERHGHRNRVQCRLQKAGEGAVLPQQHTENEARSFSWVCPPHENLSADDVMRFGKRREKVQKKKNEKRNQSHLEILAPWATGVYWDQ